MRNAGDLDAAIALTRFGLGARPGEMTDIAPDPRGWLQAQVRPQGAPNPPGAAATSAERMEQFLAYQRQSG
ncbi:MAG: DUF1800 domain-containing protein, partial [Pseudomonadota bacterium]|nr:DUF1800 domain-containing protein [Pseudomonadota bacterium]